MTSDADNIVGLYRRHAQAWAGDRGKTLHEKLWLDRFLAPLPSHPTVLDIGCGSADPIGRYLIESGCKVTGVDSSPELIAMCKEKFPIHNWLVEDVRTLSLNQVFDGVLAWDSFFHLSSENQRLMFLIFKRHSAPNGTLMFTSGISFGVAMGSYQGEPLYHASLDSEEYPTLLGTNGFDVIEHVVEDPACGRHTIWLSRRTSSETPISPTR